MVLPEQILEQLERIQCSNPKHIIFNNKEFCDHMKICAKTAQKWRDKGIISYSKINREIFYTLSDILDMLDRTKIAAYNHSNAA